MPTRRAEIEKHNAAVDAEVAQVDMEIASTFAKAKERLKSTSKPSAETDSESGESKEPSDDAVKKSFTEEEAKRTASLESKKAELSKKRMSYTHGLLMRDKAKEVPPTYVLFQGDHKAPREAVAAGFPSVLDPGTVRFVPSRNATGLRSTLARWIASRDNPWAARVIVNRLWQVHFGEGLVSTANDFGITGAAPKFPALLDWLACELMDSGWSIKHVQRLIVASRVYQQATVADPSVLTLRRQLRRLEAEQMRDRMLVASKMMDYRKGGPPIWPEIPAEILQANPAFLMITRRRRRAGILRQRLNSSSAASTWYKSERFEFPLWKRSTCPITPSRVQDVRLLLLHPQALTLLNGVQVVEAAESLARFVREASGDRNVQIRWSFAVAFCAMQRSESWKWLRRFSPTIRLRNCVERS